MFVIYPDILLLQITIVNSDQSQKISILEKFCASFFMAFCLIPDESILKQIEVISRLDVVDFIYSFFLYCVDMFLFPKSRFIHSCDLSIPKILWFFNFKFDSELNKLMFLMQRLSILVKLLFDPFHFIVNSIRLYWDVPLNFFNALAPSFVILKLDLYAVISYFNLFLTHSPFFTAGLVTKD
jgi:hypothetical protein